MEIYWLVGRRVCWWLALLASFTCTCCSIAGSPGSMIALAHLTAGISLLTDTAEGGLRDVALEIERLGDGAKAPRPKARARRRSVACPPPRGAAGRSRTSPPRKRCRKAKCVCVCSWPAAGREKAHASVR